MWKCLEDGWEAREVRPNQGAKGHSGWLRSRVQRQGGETRKGGPYILCLNFPVITEKRIQAVGLGGGNVGQNVICVFGR